MCWIRRFVTLNLSRHEGQLLIFVSNKHNEQIKWLFEQAYILFGKDMTSKHIGHSNSLRKSFRSSLVPFSFADLLCWSTQLSLHHKLKYVFFDPWDFSDGGGFPNTSFCGAHVRTVPLTTLTTVDNTPVTHLQRS